ncbi:uncharacterized protein [Choristoneura fumiferana]|uniref:uncharacterized protein n=1 Tax=Choristoneura fumiferana TaxID=7141 RepID=UPI003D156144
MAATFNLPEKLCLTGDLPSNWRRFKQELSIYLIASALDGGKDSRKIAILLNTIGEEGVQIYNNFKLETEAKYEDVIKAFDDYCEPKKNILYSRFLFYSRNQQPGESFDQFYKDIKSLSRNCDFADADEAIRDRIILGTTDKGEQERLLCLGDVKLDDAIKKLRLSEISKLQTKALHDSQNCNTTSAEVHKVEFIIKCRWCGGKHERNVSKCPARGSKCTKCGKFNHFAKVCRTRSRTDQVQVVESEDHGDQLYCDTI